MSHAPHESLPGYSPAQILVAFCDECEERGERADIAIAHLDMGSFARAWKRAAAWQKDGTERDISAPEVPMLRALFAVQCQLEPRGFPLGEIPSANVAALAAILAGWDAQDPEENL
jgi:hypothetical protein